MSDRAVVIAGGGPTGLMLAGELALAGVDVEIVERRASQELDGPRARGLHARSIEVLDQRGIADRFLAEGRAMQVQGFAGIPLDMSDLPSRRNHGLALAQSDFERILATWVAELGVPITREREVAGFRQDGSGVDVELSGDTSLRGRYLVGCDGGRSIVRKAAGIAFDGWDPSTSSLLAEVEVREEPPWGIRYDADGTQAMGRLDDGRAGVVVSQRYVGPAGEPTLDDLRRALVAVWGTDFGVHSPTWISRFTDMTRQAASYREARVLLAGDAAHVHYPVGGQGLNIGLQDAVNLGWKLGQVVRGTSPDSLLDTYHGERHPAGARVLQNTMAQTALTRSDERVAALREILSELLTMDEPRRRLAGMVSGLDVHYDLGAGHTLLGRRMPDLELETAGGPLRVFSLLHDARHVLLRLGGPAGVDTGPWAARLRTVHAAHAGAWELPAVGEVTPPTGVLVRPDGHVAWVGEGTDAGLVEALTTWIGPPPAPHRRPARRGTMSIASNPPGGAEQDARRQESA